MNIFIIFFIAIGLAMDAIAVAISSGMAIKTSRFKNALTIAIFFGVFQAFMPMLGWLAATSISDLISEIDHWAAFIILVLIGGKMIFDSIKQIRTGSESAKDFKLSIYVLFGLAIATSIDALAVGISFAFLELSIFLPALLIGLIAFAFSFSGVYIGTKLGQVLKNKVGILGGVILILIGIKILLEHTV